MNAEEQQTFGSGGVFHLTAFFSGRVQGVGFRYQTSRLAHGFEVTGYVSNLPDGRVILEAEGKENEVRAFLAEIEDQLGAYIRAVEKKESRRPQNFFDFIIK